MTYKIDACHFLASCLALLGQDKDWLGQCQDNVSEWDIKSWCYGPGFPLGQHYEVVMSVHSHKAMTLDVARMQNSKQTNKIYTYPAMILDVTKG